MPTYDYDCAACGGFDARRSISERDLPAPCPACGAASPRVLSSAPQLALMADGRRRAIGINERASHEPRLSGDYARLRHGAGCGCCGSGARRGATVTAANGAKGFPSKRPWMISH